MSEQVLYRKYRPQKWSEVVGQDHVVKVLEGSIKEDRISHAYLFSGGRGTGKTTLARIFAKALGSVDIDIYEIDGASNNGVDQIRELKESVNTLPFQSKYKVYIVDEVHMLSKGAFNAFLKTLEEPPKHVIFMLATTDPQKVIDTVLSRCQIFELKKPSREILKKYISEVAKKEGVNLESGVADLVSALGDNSFRDTLGALQKLISFSKDKKISLSEAEIVMGSPKIELVREFLKSFVVGEKEKALDIIKKVTTDSVSIKFFLELVIEKMRFVLLTKLAPNYAKSLEKDLSAEDIAIFAELSKKAETKHLLSLIEASLLMNKFKGGSDGGVIETLPLEMMILNS